MLHVSIFRITFNNYQNPIGRFFFKFILEATAAAAPAFSLHM